MILGFFTNAGLLEVQVSADRVISIRGRMTNHQFIPLEELIVKSGQGGRAADITQRIIICPHCLQDFEDVHEFIKNEFLKNPELQAGGIRYLDTRW